MHFVSKLSDKQNNSSITNSFGPNTRPPQAQLCLVFRPLGILFDDVL